VKIFSVTVFVLKMPLDSRPTWKRKMPSICHHVVWLVAVLQGTVFWQGKWRHFPLLLKVY